MDGVPFASRTGEYLGSFTKDIEKIRADQSVFRFAVALRETCKSDVHREDVVDNLTPVLLNLAGLNDFPLFYRAKPYFAASVFGDFVLCGVPDYAVYRLALDSTYENDDIVGIIAEVCFVQMKF